MGDDHRFAQLCRSVGLPAPALISHGITSLSQVAALDENDVTVLCTIEGLERERVRSARRRARKYVSQHAAERDEPREDKETESETERGCVLAGGIKRGRSSSSSCSSSSEEEVVNEASEESDYEPSSETAARRNRPQRRKKVTDAQADRDRQIERQRKTGTMEDVVGAPLARWFSEQGLGTMEELAGIDPAFYSTMAAEAGVRQPLPPPPLVSSYKLRCRCACR